MFYCQKIESTRSNEGRVIKGIIATENVKAVKFVAEKNHWLGKISSQTSFIIIET